MLSGISMTCFAASYALALGLEVVSAVSAFGVMAPEEPMSIWFVKPGNSYHETGPIGNGRLGAMIFGILSGIGMHNGYNDDYHGKPTN